MAKVLVDFGKCYEEQTKEVKEKFLQTRFLRNKKSSDFQKKIQKSIDK